MSNSKPARTGFYYMILVLYSRRYTQGLAPAGAATHLLMGQRGECWFAKKSTLYVWPQILRSSNTKTAPKTERALAFTRGHGAAWWQELTACKKRYTAADAVHCCTQRQYQPLQQLLSPHRIHICIHLFPHGERERERSTHRGQVVHVYRSTKFTAVGGRPLSLSHPHTHAVSSVPPVIIAPTGETERDRGRRDEGVGETRRAPLAIKLITCWLVPFASLSPCQQV